VRIVKWAGLVAAAMGALLGVGLWRVGLIGPWPDDDDAALYPTGYPVE
jgi:hypothetical protein